MTANQDTTEVRMRANPPGPRLEAIIDRGNRELPDGSRDNWIVCADGATLSVLASPGAYCTPRVALSGSGPLAILNEVPHGYPGPFTAVEVGYPDPRPAPSDDWQDDDGSIYPFVPVEAVRAYVAEHGGEAPVGQSIGAPPLSPAEAARVARFDAAPPLPELDEARVQTMAAELCELLAAEDFDELNPRDQKRWTDLARYALTVPGVAR